MVAKVKTINIQAFRGIPELNLELKGKNLVLKGENGTGKSSIVEAIEFFFTGKLSFFEGIGTQTLSLRRHGPHKDFSEEDVNVQMTFDPGGISLARSFEDSPSPPKQFKDYFEVAERGTFILRRAQILKFILSRPANRFRAIASILGIEPLDDIELQMKSAYDHLAGSVESKQQRISEILDEISGLLGKKVSKSERILTAINDQLEEVKLSSLESLGDVEKPAEEMLSTLRETRDLSQIAKLNQIIGELETPLVSEEVAQLVNELSTKVECLFEDQLALSDLSMAELLEKGQQAIKDTKVDICPLCGQEIERKKLLKDINTRLQTLSALSEQASDIRKMSAAVEDRLGAIEGKIQSLITEIGSFPKLKKVKNGMLRKAKFLEKFKHNLESAKELEEAISVKIFEKGKDELNDVLEILSRNCRKLLDDIGVPEDWKRKLEVIRLVDQIKTRITELNGIQEKLKLEQKRTNMAEKIYSTFTDTKKEKVEAIYKAITEDIDKFYSRLHPDDPHKNIELGVVTGRRASSSITIESFGREGEDPRALTSEGHQDSLGLCIFLAFVKKFNEGCSLVVLDDVVSTIDAQHREHICELLLEEFDDYQLLITTHDGVWYEQLRAHQRACGVSGNFRNMEIVRWTPETGPVIEPYKPRWERIQEKIADSDKRAAGSEGRQYLEWLLKEISETTMATPPYRRTGRYTVADLLAPLKNRIGKLVKDNKFKDEVLRRFKDLEKTIIMGNLLSHDNLLIEAVSIKEVERFCKTIHNLDQVFQCPECGSFVKYYQDMKRIRCPNSQCKNPIEVLCGL